MEGWLSEMGSLNGKEKLTAILEKNIESQESHYLDDFMSIRIKSAEFVLAYMKDCVNKNSLFISEIIKEGIKDDSLTTDFPDECAEVFLLLMNIWCDPAIFECSFSKLSTRLKFLQGLMRSLGIDVLSDDLVKKYLDLLQKLYPVEGNVIE